MRPRSRLPPHARALRSPARPATRAQRVLIRVTLGRLVEVVGSTTVDLAEQSAVLHHVLRTCDARRLEVER
ncbi:MAG TPA: hypothetical protein VMS55_18265 [Myxococcota bacterium]|nr:hypothetical protein [Myxococcota bacterium]